MLEKHLIELVSKINTVNVIDTGNEIFKVLCLLNKLSYDN